MIWAIALLVQYHSWFMTNLADSEVRRNMLVSSFSILILLHTDYSLGLIYSWKSCPCGICVPSNTTEPVSDNIGFALIVTP